MSEERPTRREILKKAAYIAPVIFTVAANFSFASAGSGDYYERDEKDKKDKQHKNDNTNNDNKNWTNKTRF
jgi:hypothetical protein